MLYFVQEQAESDVGVLCHGGGLCPRESDTPVMLLDPLSLRSECRFKLCQTQTDKSAVDLNSMEAKQEGVVYRILQCHLKRTHSSQSVTVETKRCNPYWK